MMMMEKANYILSIEGKDIINSGAGGYKVKSGKKFKATLDYSLEATQLQIVANAVYKNKKDRNIFYLEDNKQKTKSIIVTTFKYSVKEYQEKNIGKEKVYVKHNSCIDDLKSITFVNGLYIVDGVINAIKVDVPVEITKTQFDMPKGFSYVINEEALTFAVDTDKLETICSRDEIRETLYEKGFNIVSNGIVKKMVRFKRSSGSSREGKCLFIDETLYADIMVWSMMGLKYEETDKIDLAALEAYISLTTSSIIDTIEINPASILLIDDFEPMFTDKAMVTRVNSDNKLVTKPEDDVEIRNNIWDGQSLLDSSVFGVADNKDQVWVNGRFSDKGFILVRNRFVKSACFNTNIQKFFADNGITSIDQVNGKTLATDIKDIKMITTKSSIKYIKFGTWEDFIAQCTSTWGVVKFEKPTHYFDGSLVQTHYQLLNTLQLSPDETAELLKPSLDYVRLLKTDIRVLREHLNIRIKDDIEAGEINSTDDLMFTLLQLNNKFAKTDLFVKFKEDVIESYINNMKQAHLLISGNYSVLFGNSLEMLKATIKDKNHKMAFDGTSVLGVDKIHNTNFKFGTKLLGCRSPHVTIGNLWLSENVECEVLDTYFNLSNEIVCINSIGNNVLERLSSADFDSDALLLTDEKLIVDAVSKNYERFLVPTSKVEAKKTKRCNTLQQKADLDIKTSVNLIGEIINMSQILNSKLWNMVNSGESEDKIQELYAIISQLDVMSCIEIDRAKKEFVIDNADELKIIRQKWLDTEIVNKNGKVASKKIKAIWQDIMDLKADEQDTKDLRKLVKDYSQLTVRPKFFKIVAKGDNYYFRKHETTMDYLEEIITAEMKTIRSKRRQGENKVVTIGELFAPTDISLSDANTDQMNKIVDGCMNLKLQTSIVWKNDSLTGEEQYKQSSHLKNEYINEVSKLKVNAITIKKIIYDLDQESKKLKNGEVPKTNLTNIGRKLLSILFKAHTESFVEIFAESKEKVETIKRAYRIIEGSEVIRMYNIDFIVKKVV